MKLKNQDESHSEGVELQNEGPGCPVERQTAPGEYLGYPPFKGIKRDAEARPSPLAPISTVPNTPRRRRDESRRATTTETSVTHVPGSKCYPCPGWTQRGERHEAGRSSRRLAQASSGPGVGKTAEATKPETRHPHRGRRYLAAKQPVELQLTPRTEKAAEYRLRSLSGEARHPNNPLVVPPGYRHRRWLPHRPTPRPAPGPQSPPRC